MESLEKVGLKQLIGQLEQGLDTPVGEKGITLSGGERQRLALARLFFSDAKIVILDEATSAMDNLTEQSVMENLLKYLKGKTIIMIAHRLTSIKDVERIIVLKAGKIEGDGDYRTLIENNSYFSALALKEENDLQQNQIG